MNPKFVVIRGDLLTIKEIVEVTKKSLILRLVGIRELKHIRKNGKDGKIYSRRPLSW